VRSYKVRYHVGSIWKHDILLANEDAILLHFITRGIS